MLDIIKLAMRYRTDVFDNEINMYINSCITNLVHAGVNPLKIVESDDAIINTITSFVKWQMNFENRGAEWEKIYKDLRLSITLDSNYK